MFGTKQSFVFFSCPKTFENLKDFHGRENHKSFLWNLKQTTPVRNLSGFLSISGIFYIPEYYQELEILEAIENLHSQSAKNYEIILATFKTKCFEVFKVW